MRVLLICIPRSGSSSFMKAVAKGLNLSRISIPDSYSFPENKALIDKVIQKENVIFRMSPNHEIGYDIDKFSKFFDKTILLSRQNNDEHYKSIVNLYYREHILQSGVHSSYVYEDIPQSTLKQIQPVVDFEDILTQKEKLKNIAYTINEKIIYYENIFYSLSVEQYLIDNFKNLSIEKYKNELSNTSKLSISRQKTLV